MTQNIIKQPINISLDTILDTIVKNYPVIIQFLSLLCSVIENVYQALKELDQVSNVAMDLLECRIGRRLQAMSSCCLLVLPEDSPVSPQDLLLQTVSLVRAAASTLSW